LRALTPIREIVTDVAETENAGCVDFVRIIREHSPDGIPGSELFLDHVHPTIEGNRLLALAIVREMTQEGMVSPAATWNEELIARISEELENSLDEKTHAIALRNLSKVLNWAGKHDEAARLVDLAADMIPEDGEIHAQKGILLWRAGDREGALVHYQEAVRLEPWNARIHRSLGILLSELNRLDEALAELEEAVRLDPELPNGHYDLGIVLQALGKMNEAESAYRTAVKLDPDHAEAYNNLGIILALRGDFTAAYAQFARALEADPDNEEAARNLERAREVLGQSNN
jgi:Flp pilus assembly protein TadD